MVLRTLIITLILGAGLVFAVFQSGVNEMVALLPKTDALVLNHRAKEKPKLAPAEAAALVPVEEIPQSEISKTGEIKKILPEEAAISTPAESESPKIVKSQVSQNDALTRQGVIEQTNLQRRANLGMDSDLAENNLLNIAAQKKVDDMFALQYFEHTSLSGVSANGLVAAAGYEYIAAGENLAMGDFDSDADLVNSWMNSPGHRANILKSGYKEIGVAVGYGMFNGRMAWLAVQEFAVPKNSCPRVDESLSAAVDRAKASLENFTKTQNELAAKIEREKAAIASLKNDLDNLIRADGADGEIKQKQDEYNTAASQLNRDIDTYNANIKQTQSLYNSYKTQVALYNSQVSAFNSCAGAIK